MLLRTMWPGLKRGWARSRHLWRLRKPGGGEVQAKELEAKARDMNANIMKMEQELEDLHFRDSDQFHVRKGLTNEWTLI